MLGGGLLDRRPQRRRHLRERFVDVALHLLECAGVAQRQLGVEVVEEVARVGDVPAAAAHRHHDDGDVVRYRLPQLEDAPRPRQQLLGRQQHEHVGAVDAVGEERAQVGEVGRVEEDGAAEHPLEQVAQVARVGAALRFEVREEAGEAVGGGGHPARARRSHHLVAARDVRPLPMEEPPPSDDGPSARSSSTATPTCRGGGGGAARSGRRRRRRSTRATGAPPPTPRTTRTACRRRWPELRAQWARTVAGAGAAAPAAAAAVAAAAATVAAARAVASTAAATAAAASAAASAAAPAAAKAAATAAASRAAAAAPAARPPGTPEGTPAAAATAAVATRAAARRRRGRRRRRRRRGREVEVGFERHVHRTEARAERGLDPRHRRVCVVARPLRLKSDVRAHLVEVDVEVADFRICSLEFFEHRKSKIDRRRAVVGHPVAVDNDRARHHHDDRERVEAPPPLLLEGLGRADGVRAADVGFRAVFRRVSNDEHLAADGARQLEDDEGRRAGDGVLLRLHLHPQLRGAAHLDLHARLGEGGERGARWRRAAPPTRWRPSTLAAMAAARLVSRASAVDVDATSTRHHHASGANGGGGTSGSDGGGGGGDAGGGGGDGGGDRGGDGGGDGVGAAAATTEAAGSAAGSRAGVGGPPRGGRAGGLPPGRARAPAAAGVVGDDHVPVARPVVDAAYVVVRGGHSIEATPDGARTASPARRRNVRLTAGAHSRAATAAAAAATPAAAAVTVAAAPAAAATAAAAPAAAATAAAERETDSSAAAATGACLGAREEARGGGGLGGGGGGGGDGGGAGGGGDGGGGGARDGGGGVGGGGDGGGGVVMPTVAVAGRRRRRGGDGDADGGGGDGGDADGGGGDGGGGGGGGDGGGGGAAVAASVVAARAAAATVAAAWAGATWRRRGGGGDGDAGDDGGAAALRNSKGGCRGLAFMQDGVAGAPYADALARAVGVAEPRGKWPGLSRTALHPRERLRRSRAYVTPASAAASMISDDVSTPLVVVRSHMSPLPAHVAVQLSPCAP